MKQSEKTAFLSFVISIALPSALQGMITVAMNFIDTLMLGKLTENSIAAVSLASQPMFLFTVVHFGLSGGSSVLTAQFWSSKDIGSLKKTMGLRSVQWLYCAR